MSSSKLIKEEMTINLINKVREKAELWDIRSERYKRADKKELWSKIADECGFSGKIYN